MSYQAVVARIHTHPHPNADRLQLGTVCGNQVVVGLDTQDGELGVFFGPDGQLSHDFCVANGLYNESARRALGLPVADGEKYGFFSENRRVRAQNFRGVKSDGFWVPLSYFGYLNVRDLGVEFPEGYQFTAHNGQEICEKYYTPATRLAMARREYIKKRENAMFPKHADTGQFRFVAVLPEDSIVYLTEKLHGTSGRYGLVLDEVPATGFKGWVNRVTGRTMFKPMKAWTYLNGSKNVILEKTQGPGFYGTNDFRYDVVRNITLHKGEVLYFEIVGDVIEGQPIMPSQDTTKVKGLDKLYGKRMSYTYGCQPGEHRMYVYKIIQVNEDGKEIELTWTQMRRRCMELGLKTVPLLARVFYKDIDQLRKLVDEHTDATLGSKLDSRHIREGVVIRVETEEGPITHVKNKSWEFGVLEGYIKERDTYVDLEEIA